MKLKTIVEIQIDHLDDLISNQKVTFNPSQNVIVGRNGAGKTTVLSLVQAIANFNFEEMRDTDFKVSFVGLILGQATVTATISNQSAKPKLDSSQLSSASDFDLANISGDDSQFSYDVKIQVEQHEIIFRGANDDLSEASIDGKPFEPRFHFGTEYAPFGMFITSDDSLQLAGGKEKRLDQILGRINRIEFSSRVKEGVSDFETITKKAPLTIRLMDGGGFSLAIDTRRFVEWSVMQNLFSRHTRQINAGGQEESLLDQFQNWLVIDDVSDASFGLFLREFNAKSIRVRFKIASQENKAKKKTIEFRGVDFLIDFKSGKTIRGNDLTFGQKRFLATCLILNIGHTVPCIIDEIDNGYHPTTVRNLIDAISNRQAFVSSHNKLVLDCLNYNSPAELSEKIHFVDRNSEGLTQITHLDPKRAKSVYEKISVEFLEPSDVLNVMGLW